MTPGLPFGPPLAKSHGDKFDLDMIMVERKDSTRKKESDPRLRCAGPSCLLVEHTMCTLLRINTPEKVRLLSKLSIDNVN